MNDVDVRAGRTVGLRKGTVIRLPNGETTVLRESITVLVEHVDDGVMFWRHDWLSDEERSCPVTSARPAYLT